jgi:prophage regulatory protein
MRQPIPIPDDISILRFRDLVETGIVRNRSTLDRWVRAGRFPAPVRLGEHSVGWRLVDVRQWLEELASENSE